MWSPNPSLRFFVLIESGAGESNHDQHHAEVDDVSTVAARVAVRELDHGGEHTLSGLVGDNATAAVELAGNGERDESCEKDCHQRVEVADVMPGLQAEDAPQLAGVNITTRATSSAASRGQVKLRFRLSKDVLRQARAGQSQSTVTRPVRLEWRRGYRRAPPL